MPQLDPTWFASQLFWLLITFTALYFVLARLVLPPLQGVLARREDTVKTDLDTAQRSKADAEHARLDYERTLADARNRSQAIMGDVMLAHKTRSEQAGKDVDKQITSKLAEAEKKITAKKQELIAALTPTAAELAGMIVEKLTQKAPAADKVNAILTQLSKQRG